MQQDTLTQPWWRGRRVQLSMRGLMVVVLVLGVVLGWVVRRAQIQRDVVAAIEQGGGIVYYNWETPGFHTQPDGRILGGTPRKKKGALGGPKWLVDRLGPDYLGHVTQVRVGPKDPDAVMARVARLEGLEALNFLLAVPVSDAGFKHVREMKDLVVMSTPIRGAQLTGASLESLKDSTRLRAILFTNYPPVSDANLVYLKRLTALADACGASDTAKCDHQCGPGQPQRDDRHEGTDFARVEPDVNRAGEPARNDPFDRAADSLDSCQRD